MTFQFISNTVILLLTYVKWLIIIINYRSLNYAVKQGCVCLEILIYKRLQMLRHNDVIDRNEYLIST